MYVMVFQLSIFRTFQRIFAMKDLPQHKELVKFATYIMRQFFKVVQTNKTVYMEALFWKSSKDAYEIEAGYGSYNAKSTIQVWTEENEDELRRLFMEHQQNQVEEDVVDWIVNNLIDNTRTRRGVLKKLKEMCLLTEYKGRKKSGVRARIPQSWGAEEETQLQELYEQFKDAMDPLGCIMSRLDVSRPKNRIIEKMLLMGLIQDKKEVRKKRVKGDKSGKGKSGARGSDQESESNSDSDDNSYPQSSSTSTTVARRPTTSKKIPPKRNISGKKKGKAHVQVARTQLVKLLITNVEAGRDEALEWLKESLSDAIEDFEDGNNEGIPLVPIMDYAQDAMDNTEFQQLLKAFGICEPFDEQEIYWRIPGHLTSEILKNHSSLIQEALDKTLRIAENDNNQVSQHVESDDDDDIFSKLRNATSQQGNNDISTSAQNEESSDEDVFEKLRNNSFQLQKQTNATEDVDQTSNDHAETEDNNDLEEHSNTEDLNNSIQKKRAKQIIDSDEESDDAGSVTTKRNIKNTINSESEDEADKENVNGNENKETDFKRSRSESNSDSEKPVTKRTRVLIDSDDE